MATEAGFVICWAGDHKEAAVQMPVEVGVQASHGVAARHRHYTGRRLRGSIVASMGALHVRVLTMGIFRDLFNALRLLHRHLRPRVDWLWWPDRQAADRGYAPHRGSDVFRTKWSPVSASSGRQLFGDAKVHSQGRVGSRRERKAS